MKLIIIEGTDNTGKDTLISKILEKYPTATVIHCGKPITKKYSSKEQDELFRIYAENIVEGKYDNTHVIIMNRKASFQLCFFALQKMNSILKTYNLCVRSCRTTKYCH